MNSGWGPTAKHAPSAGVRHAFHEASFVSIANAFLKGPHSKVQNAAVELQITLTQPLRVSPPASRMASSKFFTPTKLFSEKPVLSRLRGMNPFETKTPTMPMPVNNVSPSFEHVPGVFDMSFTRPLLEKRATGCTSLSSLDALAWVSAPS